MQSSVGPVVPAWRSKARGRIDESVQTFLETISGAEPGCTTRDMRTPGMTRRRQYDPLAAAQRLIEVATNFEAAT
jgi:hypothetical protein